MHQYDTSAYDVNHGHTTVLARDIRPEMGPFNGNRLGFVTPGFGKALLEKLPADSFVLEVYFKLVTPYVSKDDVGPAEEHSPIVKDWVYQVPMVRPTTWKGRLRFSAKQHGAEDGLVNRLFGPPAESEESQEGRLHFFPTLFVPAADGLAVTVTEIINPHDRRTRRGTGRVNLTCVRAGTEGRFSLLYLGPKDTLENALPNLLISWLREMIEFHGIGAKTLKGFGLGHIERTWLTTAAGRSSVPQPNAGNQQ